MTINRPQIREPMHGVFYWIEPGQGFVLYGRDIKMEELGYRHRFVPCPLLQEPNEGFDFTEVRDSTGTFSKPLRCEDCNTEWSKFESKSFLVKNVIPQCFIDDQSEGYIYEKQKRELERAGFDGLQFIPNKPKDSFKTYDGFPAELNQKYFYIQTTTLLFQVPGECQPESDNACWSCQKQPLICKKCGEVRTRCPNCGERTELIEKTCTLTESIPGGDGSGWPLRLSSWELTDFNGGSWLYVVTGEVLEFFLENGFSPFAFGPIAVESSGASRKQLERARKVSRDISL